MNKNLGFRLINFLLALIYVVAGWKIYELYCTSMLYSSQPWRCDSAFLMGLPLFIISIFLRKFFYFRIYPIGEKAKKPVLVYLKNTIKLTALGAVFIFVLMFVLFGFTIPTDMNALFFVIPLFVLAALFVIEVIVYVVLKLINRQRNR